MADRAVSCIDGNNWYLSLVALGVPDLGRLNYAKISEKLVGPRTWVGTRYYIGQVKNVGNPKLYADQRSFLQRLRATDSRISVHLGRLEPRSVTNAAAVELRRYLNALTVRLDEKVFHDLVDIAKRHASSEVMVEKAVDVMLACLRLTSSLWPNATSLTPRTSSPQTETTRLRRRQPQR